MNLLLDTHAVLWSFSDPDELSKQAQSAIRDANNEVFVSAATAWEMAIMAARGKLDAPDDLSSRIKAARMRPLHVTIEHALAVRDLPVHHQDPFDRLLVAQAQVEALTLVTRDRVLGQYDVRTMDC